MNNKGSRSGLFLMELIMSILIFTVAATICTQMFIKSHILSQNSIELNNAVIWCESMAESFYAADGKLEGMTDTLNKASANDNLIVYTPNEDYRVEGILTIEEGSNLHTLSITCTSNLDNNIVYSLSPVLYPKKSR